LGQIYWKGGVFMSNWNPIVFGYNNELNDDISKAIIEVITLIYSGMYTNVSIEDVTVIENSESNSATILIKFTSSCNQDSKIISDFEGRKALKKFKEMFLKIFEGRFSGIINSDKFEFRNVVTSKTKELFISEFYGRISQ
jgi:hypothetical protein